GAPGRVNSSDLTPAFGHPSPSTTDGEGHGAGAVSALAARWKTGPLSATDQPLAWSHTLLTPAFGHPSPRTARGEGPEAGAGLLPGHTSSALSSPGQSALTLVPAAPPSASGPSPSAVD